MATNQEFMDLFDITSSQLTKLGEHLDRRSPKTDENGNPRPNDVNDAIAHMKDRYNADIVSDLKQQQPAPEWD